MTEDDPFIYPEQISEDEIKRRKQRETQKRYRDRLRGGPPKPRGGTREGAGRKPSGVVKDTQTVPILLRLTRIQILLLLEMGHGTLTSGIQAHLDRTIV